MASGGTGSSETRGTVVAVVNPRGAEPVLYVRLAAPSPFREGQAVVITKAAKP